MKLYDFDGMFDEKLSEYISKNPQRYTESRWEEVIPALYQKFGDTKIKSLGLTPREFYAKMNAEELVRCIRLHAKKGVPISEFLSDEVEKKVPHSLILPLLEGEESEMECAIRFLGADGGAIDKYLDILVSDADAELKERCAELIKEKADDVAERALAFLEAGKEREYMLEILSRTVKRRDKVFEALLKEFRSGDDLSASARNLAYYGDERALDYLYEAISDENLNYIDFREIKFAIESLGGEYDGERDFSNDPTFVALSAHDPVQDIFDKLKNK